MVAMGHTTDGNIRKTVDPCKFLHIRNTRVIDVKEKKKSVSNPNLKTYQQEFDRLEPQLREAGFFEDGTAITVSLIKTKLQELGLPYKTGRKHELAARLVAYILETSNGTDAARGVLAVNQLDMRDGDDDFADIDIGDVNEEGEEEGEDMEGEEEI